MSRNPQSLAAWDSVTTPESPGLESLTQRYRREILEAMAKMPDREGNCSQIAEYCNLYKQEITKRIVELVREGKVIDTGRTAPSDSGRKAAVYRLPAPAAKKIHPAFQPFPSGPQGDLFQQP